MFEVREGSPMKFLELIVLVITLVFVVLGAFATTSYVAGILGRVVCAFFMIGWEHGGAVLL